MVMGRGLKVLVIGNGSWVIAAVTFASYIEDDAVRSVRTGLDDARNRYVTPLGCRVVVDSYTRGPCDAHGSGRFRSE
jgi:hypothetical protein